jgi:hypothetical protein
LHAVFPSLDLCLVRFGGVRGPQGAAGVGSAPERRTHAATIVDNRPCNKVQARASDNGVQNGYLDV